jgi:hypothetical protein
LFDAVTALVQVEDGDLDAPAVVAARIADVPVEASGHGVACGAWLVAGEVAFRTGQPAAARQCFETVLAHPFGGMPYHRAHALAGIAGTLRGADARPFAVEASSLRDQHGFVTPRWFTIGCFDGS